ncbi:PspC domain-containing protein [Edaphobacillus lindanitolerans]|uniref:Phage shock protein C (PspC) family protein n=1 Tax=Edaphobacillus lindanitolerans TaxID=550447 RepID=A0A1U7PS38_9BACI|nr:PspC domain-containing protein [Edaphobacillus lindanitolerans]SIT88470.1 phage shock protein C (PspC) family protein [Edaphobacillus lindanitolerans]
MTKLARSLNDKALFGVCSGIAAFIGISPFWIRLLFLLTPASPLIYLGLAITLPPDPAPL